MTSIPIGSTSHFIFLALFLGSLILKGLMRTTVSPTFWERWKRSAIWMALGAASRAASAYAPPRSRLIILTPGWAWSQAAVVAFSRSAIMRDKLRKVKPPAKQPRPCGVAPDGYNAALDLSHTALRARPARVKGILVCCIVRPSLSLCECKG